MYDSISVTLQEKKTFLVTEVTLSHFTVYSSPTFLAQRHSKTTFSKLSPSIRLNAHNFNKGKKKKKNKTKQKKQVSSDNVHTCITCIYSREPTCKYIHICGPKF